MNSGTRIRTILALALFTSGQQLFAAEALNQAPSIPRFLQVTPQIYRGGRPSAAGLDYVKSLGVRTVIDLEDDAQAMAQERQYAAKIGLGWISEPMSSAVSPSDQEVSTILSLLQQAPRLPAFIHCKHGQDRTGLIMGLYRVVTQRWTPAQAYQEMLQDGFHSQYTALDQYFRVKTGYRKSVMKDGMAIASRGVPQLEKVMIVVFENEDASSVQDQPFFSEFAKAGATLLNIKAVSHPSQPNYIAMTSGGTQGIWNDSNHDINATNIVDLLEAKGKTWKAYAEGWPGKCFTGARSGTYARKHVPFISYLNIQKNPARCANIVDASQMDQDLANGTLPDYAFYTPDMNNDGHDTSVEYADRYFARRFGPLLKDPRFAKETLIATFDEGETFGNNLIYTAFGVAPV